MGNSISRKEVIQRLKDCHVDISHDDPKTIWVKGHIYEAISILEKQEEHSSTQMRGYIRSLKFNLQFLGDYFHFSTNKALKLRIDKAVYKLSQELDSISRNSMPAEERLLESTYKNMQKKIKDVFSKPETLEYDVIFRIFGEGYRGLRRIEEFVNNFENVLRVEIDGVSLLMQDFKEKLILLKPLLNYLGKVSGTKAEILLSPEKFSGLGKAACLLYSFLAGEVDEETVSLVRYLPGEIKVQEFYMVVLRASTKWNDDLLMKREYYLLDKLIALVECNSDSVLHSGHPTKRLLEELKPTRVFLENLPDKWRNENFSYYLPKYIEAITSKVIPIIYSSCCDVELKEDLVREGYTALPEMLSQIKHIQEEGFWEQIKLYSYPITSGLGFLDFFLGYLDQLQLRWLELDEIMKNEIETIGVEFKSLTEIMKQKQDTTEQLNNSWTRVVCLAYQAEHLIDLSLVKGAPDSRIRFSLLKIIEDVNLIKSEVTKFPDKEIHRARAVDVSKALSHIPSEASYKSTLDEKTSNLASQSPSTAIDEEVVGFEDVEKKLMEDIFSDIKQLDIVSIVGMPGLGKTTLAKKIYEDPSISQNFDVRAWCCVSQTYQKRELLLTLLTIVTPLPSDIHQKTDDDLVVLLARCLKKRRYFIVIDDLWDIKAWNDLKRAFPNDFNRSRIMMTGRHYHVASQAGCHAASKVHRLRELTDDESLKLFHVKLLQGGNSFPVELFKLGEQAVKACKGLPLAVVVAASLLGRVEKETRNWKQIVDSIRSHMWNDSTSQFKTIFEVSYAHLPDHLKACLLYLGAFPEDKEIPVWKLKCLWAAEGFTGGIQSRSSENAERYLMDLINRSLIIPTKERLLGGVKAIRIHDLVREFCLEKAKEEKFLLSVQANGSSGLPREFDVRRLCIYSDSKEFEFAKPYGYGVRSLLHRAPHRYSDPTDASFLHKSFSLLKVVDIPNLDISKSFESIALLIHLRYLAVLFRLTAIPSTISNLKNLQTLIVLSRIYYEDLPSRLKPFLTSIGTSQIYCEDADQEVSLPDSIWDMVELKHVQIADRPCTYLSCRKGTKSSLDNLETLSTPVLSYGEHTENTLRRLPNLRKLKCIFVYAGGNCRYCLRFPVLNFLHKLESLNVTYRGDYHVGVSCVFDFPFNLRKLTLSWFRMTWEEVSEIGRKLRFLEVLKLKHGAVRGKIWNVGEGAFPELKYLKLSGVSIEEWNASEDLFPKLEKLVLEKCYDLNEIPSCFGEIFTLRMIKVKGCRKSVDDSVRRIRKLQQEQCNEELRVTIYPMVQLSLPQIKLGWRWKLFEVAVNSVFYYGVWLAGRKVLKVAKRTRLQNSGKI